MPTPTYDLLGTVTAGAATSIVTFSSIDQVYGDLVLVNDNVGELKQGVIRFNSDSGSNYEYAMMKGSGSTVTRDSGGAGGIFTMPTTAVTQSIHHFFDYSSTNKHKVVLGTGVGSDGVLAQVARWQSNNAITTITYSMSFPVGATISLYGITKTVV